MQTCAPEYGIVIEEQCKQFRVMNINYLIIYYRYLDIRQYDFDTHQQLNSHIIGGYDEEPKSEKADCQPRHRRDDRHECGI